MSQMNIPDFSGVSTAVEKPNPNGQQSMAGSRPVAIASDQSVIPINDNSGSITVDAPVATPLFVRLSDGAAAVTPLIGAQLPSSLGIKTAANSLSVTHASDDAVLAVTGAVGDAAWASGNGTLNALLKAIATVATDTTTDSPVAVHQPCDVISFTPTLDTAAYAAGDVLFATAAISGVTRANDLRASLMSLTAIDKSKQAPAFTLLFYQTNVTSAAANAANNLSDADQINLLGYVDIAAADWKTFANNSVLCYSSGSGKLPVLLEAATGTTTVYVVGILNAGTPTFAAGDLVLKLGVVQQ